MFRKKRIAVFGGSFNPPTEAHYAMAKDVSKVVDEVWVCPSFSHRGKGDHSKSFNHRVAMCELAFRDLPKVRVSTAEYVSYSYYKGDPGVGSSLFLMRTVNKLSSEKNPRLLLMIGADCLKDCHNWYQYESLVKINSGFIIYKRKGVELSLLERSMLKKPFCHHSGDTKSCISSTEIRENIKRSLVSDGLNPEVLSYIQRLELYREEP